MGWGVRHISRSHRKTSNAPKNSNTGDQQPTRGGQRRSRMGRSWVGSSLVGRGFSRDISAEIKGALAPDGAMRRTALERISIRPS